MGNGWGAGGCGLKAERTDSEKYYLNPPVLKKVDGEGQLPEQEALSTNVPKLKQTHCRYKEENSTACNLFSH